MAPHNVMAVLQDVGFSPQDFNALLYFSLAGFVTLGIETLRRWVKRRMDIWEAKNPLPGTPEWERLNKERDVDDQ